MRNLQVCPDIIALFFNATVPSVLMYAGVAFYQMLTQKLKKDLDRPYRICSKFLTNCLDNNSIYYKRMLSMGQYLMKDRDHPLHHEFCWLPSGRRMRSIYSRTVRFRNTFVPSCVRLLNENM